MNVNNRRVEKEDLTFFQWLNIMKLLIKTSIIVYYNCIFNKEEGVD